MKRFPFLAVIMLAALIAAVVLFLERAAQRPENSDTRGIPGKETPERVSTGKTPGSDLGTTPREAMYPSRSIAMIIDDIGFDTRIVEELAGIPAPIAFAVLPHAPHAVEAARILHAAGKVILLHLPMEPKSYPEESPGTETLMTDMDEEAIRRRVRADLATVPFVSGVNNHMGSRFMEDEARLAIVMEVLRERGLFFVDSLTTADSKGRESAKRAGVRFAARDIFIDHVPGYAAALEKLTGVFRQGRRNGLPVLMIGHPHMETVKAIRAALPIWKTRGVKVIPVSDCLGIFPGSAKTARSQQRTER